jgi:hypothetical protein
LSGSYRARDAAITLFSSPGDRCSDASGIQLVAVEAGGEQLVPFVPLDNLPIE